MPNGQVDLDRIAELLPVSFQQYERYIASQCIFHDDSRPSLMIYADKYNCMACGKWGYTSKLLEKLESDAGVFISRPRTRINFSNPFSVWMQNQTLVDALKSAWANNKKRPSIYMTDDRKIHPKHQIKHGIGLRDGWITFPIKSKDGKIIGAVARTLPGLNEQSKYIVPSGQDPNFLYVPNWSVFEKSRKIFITFGIIDALTLSIYGFPVASTVSGKRIEPSAFNDMRKLIVFIPDKNEESDANKIASKLDWRGKVLKVNYPDNCKDINDVHVNYPEKLREEQKTWLS